MAAGDLTTVERLRGHLRLEDQSDDELLATLVSVASAWAKVQIDRDVVAADYTDTVSGDGGSEVVLREYPVLSVASVTVDGAAIPQRTAGDGWELDDPKSGVLVLVGYRFTRGFRNVVVAYRAGWETVPDDLAQAVLEEAALRYRDRDWGGATYKLQGGDIVDRRGEASSGSWAFIRGVLDKYRRVRV